MRRPASPRRPIIVGILLFSLSVVCLVFDRGETGAGPMSRAVSRVFSPLQLLVSRAASSVRELRQDYVALTEVRAQNRALALELQKLRDERADLEGLRTENDRLRGLLELADKRKDLRLRAARVAGRSVSPYFRVMKLVIEAGAETVKPGLPVIAPGGLVGQVRSVTGDRAEVLLVTDPRSAIDVVLETSRARGLAVGTGEPDRYAARLEYLQRSDETVTGERVLTTGDDGRYPRGLAVGRVTSLKPQAHGLFQDAELEPMVDLSALEEVFIVLGPSGLNEEGTDIDRANKPDRPDRPEPNAAPGSSPAVRGGAVP